MMLIKKLALMLSSLLFTLLLMEVGLRLLGYSAIYEVYSKPSIFWEHDPLLGWTHTPNSSEIYRGPRPWPIEFENEMHINSLGLRGPEVEDVPEGGLRILFAGDSGVAAFEVPYEETFVSLLAGRLSERLGRPVQTINAGVRGYGTDQSYLAYREKWSKLDPDVVVFFASANDARNNITLHRMRRVFGKGAASLTPEGELRFDDEPVPHYPHCTAYRMGSDFAKRQIHTPMTRLACTLQMTFSDHSALFTLVTQIIQQNPGALKAIYNLGSPSKNELVEGQASREKAGDAPNYARKLTTALILRFAEDVSRDGAIFVLAVNDYEFVRFPPGVFDQAGIPVMLPTDALNARPEGTAIRFLRDAHYNTYGHQLAADLMEEKLVELLSE